MITMSATITTTIKTRSVTTLSIPASDCAHNLVLCVQYEQWYARHDERRAQHSDWKRSPTVEKPSAYATHCKVSKVSVYPNHWCFEDGSLLLFAYVSQPCRLWSPVLFSTSKSKIRNMLPVLVHNMISKKKRSCRLSVFLSLRNLEPNKYHKTAWNDIRHIFVCAHTCTSIFNTKTCKETFIKTKQIWNRQKRYCYYYHYYY